MDEQKQYEQRLIAMLNAYDPREASDELTQAVENAYGRNYAHGECLAGQQTDFERECGSLV